MNPSSNPSMPIPRQGRANPESPRVHLHIERLVLDGLPFDARQARRLQTVFTAELTRRLQADPSLATDLRNHAHDRHGPRVSLPPGVTPEAAGRALAHALLGARANASKPMRSGEGGRRP